MLVIRTLIALSLLAGTASAQSTAWVLTPSSVLALDLSRGDVVAQFAAGNYPDFAISQNGKRLFIADRTITSVDAESGKILSSAPNPDAPIYKLPLSVSQMTASADGSRLYLIKRETRGGKDSTWLMSFNVEKGSFDSARVSLGDRCAGAALKLRSPSQLDVVCGGRNTIYVASIGDSGTLESATHFALPPPPALLLNGQAHAAGDIRSVIWGPGTDVYLVRLDGRVIHADTRTGSVVNEGTQPLAFLWTSYGSGAISEDRRSLFFGCSPLNDYSGLGQYICEVDANSLSPIRQIKVSHPFSSIASLPDSGGLVMTAAGALIIADEHTLQEKRSLPLPASPSMVRFP
ncbi:MAG TPA: hypothetical protein VN736_15000 [Candidatus Limnocylindrales bacterium]|nr:hypothetical protein [Candidatus Limnocylindrales bacterium]